MSSAWLSAAILEFEQVTLDNGTELFRVQARARRGDDPEPRPVLVTWEQGAIAHTYEPLSSGGDRRGLLRLAYAIPTERVGPSTGFSLQLPNGHRIDLPKPTPGERRAETEDDERWKGDEPGWEEHDSREPDDGTAQQIAELERELSELRSANGEIRRQLAELTAEHEQAATAAARDREQLEQELGELGSANAELQRHLAELTAEHDQAATAAARDHEELESLRGSHGAVEEELRSTRESVAHALSELELAHAERDAARQAAESAQAERDDALGAAESARRSRDESFAQVSTAQAERDDARRDAESMRAERGDARRAAESARGERDDAQRAAEAAHAERDEALETTRDQRAEHARLTGRLRQLQARTELLRADAAGAGPGTDPRLRRLESEREQLAVHVRALAELLSSGGRVRDAAEPRDAAAPGEAVAESAADQLETIRARAVKEANEDAERELLRLRAGAPL